MGSKRSPLQSGFWGELRRPFFVLAPMANVTDVAFRRVIARYGKPDVMFTQFVSADGLVSPGASALLHDLRYDESERPIVAQLFGADPERMRRAARIVRDLGFDGLDINMGCPDRSVEKQGAGAALMKHPARARELILAAKAGAGELPVSVKTRIGYDRDELERWLPELLAEGPAAITVHARTRREMSKVPAQWEAVQRAVRLAAGTGTVIIGNGDVMTIAEGLTRAEETGASGIMMGRAVFGNPWLFSGRERPMLEERVRVMLEHTALFEELLGAVKPFHIMRKHFASYLGAFPGVRKLRVALMSANSRSDAERTIKEFIGS